MECCTCDACACATYYRAALSLAAPALFIAVGAIVALVRGKI